tara:strand:- start:213 stop:404 length:192 start_codon:yes stop_codon:yes gene_type:complete
MIDYSEDTDEELIRRLGRLEAADLTLRAHAARGEGYAAARAIIDECRAEALRRMRRGSDGAAS